jgi:hypothetical protein
MKPTKKVAILSSQDKIAAIAIEAKKRNTSYGILLQKLTKSQLDILYMEYAEYKLNKSRK